jgi:hypothetical protein
VRRAAENQRIVIAGTSYAGLHVVLRLATKRADNPGVELTLVDRHDYHQTLTELPQVGAGTHAATRCTSRRSGSCASGSDSPRPSPSASTWPLGRRGGNTDSVFKITAKALQSVLPHSSCIELPDLDHRSVQQTERIAPLLQVFVHPARI